MFSVKSRDQKEFNKCHWCVNVWQTKSIRPTWYSFLHYNCNIFAPKMYIDFLTYFFCRYHRHQFTRLQKQWNWCAIGSFVLLMFIRWPITMAVINTNWIAFDRRAHQKSDENQSNFKRALSRTDTKQPINVLISQKKTDWKWGSLSCIRRMFQSSAKIICTQTKSISWRQLRILYEFTIKISLTLDIMLSIEFENKVMEAV